MNIFESLLLGTVQGLTEFLPISSSGHLILIRDLLGINTGGGLAFDAILQLGTILAVFVYFRKTIVDLIVGRDKKLLVALAIGTIPALALGLLLEDAMETIFRNPLLVAAMLIAGSLLFIFAERFGKHPQDAGRGTEDVPHPKPAFLIGVFQSLALIPGVSRSGATISGGLILGMGREAAARFSFLLSLPIITGTGLKKLWDVTQISGLEYNALNLSAGFIAAFLVGLACISFLLRYLKNHTLYVFAAYRIALALAVFAIKT